MVRSFDLPWKKFLVFFDWKSGHHQSDSFFAVGFKDRNERFVNKLGEVEVLRLDVQTTDLRIRIAGQDLT